ncbi:MAG: HD domain-containing protein [Clostridia bacterium]|nr:HD domain-containing protein [Clostridia bacterium]
MNTKEIQKIIELYELTCKLKTTLRQGWVNWELENVRIESIAEHIFGTCMLAMGIYASKKIDIDIQKVFMMLVLHETEEIIIGDLTPFDQEKIKTKKIDGRKAVLSIFKGFKNAKYFLNIIEEFEEGITEEAKFTRQCDKLEADLQARLYEENFNLKKVADKYLKDERILALNKKGYTKVSQLYLQNDKKLYSNEFLEIANRLEKIDNKKPRI